MDMTESIIPRSDQINADDLIAGPMTVTVREVIAGVAEPPFDFLLVETDRAYRPSKTMRRVIVAAWGPLAANYAGRRLTLYREPSIKFGGQEVGGIRISHMSHIEGPVEVMAQTTRGKREKFTVQPLADPPVARPPGPLAEPIAAGPLPLRQQLTHMSQQEKADLWRFAGLERNTKMQDVKARLIAYADELGLDFTEEPDARRILERARDAQPKGSAEAYQRWLDTGEDTDPGDQTTLDAEALA